MARAIRTWNAKAVQAATRVELERRMERACLMVEDTAKRLVNRGNPGGHNPSKPGEPPKKVTGGLQSKFGHRVTSTPTVVTGSVGNSAAQARRLELGFSGADSLGRVYNQAPRPYLRPALANREKALAKLFGAR